MGWGSDRLVLSLDCITPEFLCAPLSGWKVLWALCLEHLHTPAPMFISRLLLQEQVQKALKDIQELRAENDATEAKSQTTLGPSINLSRNGPALRG